MAKTDNLTDFLTGVADAIRTKKGTTAKINPQNFEIEIESIKGNKFIELVQRTIKTVTEDDLQGLISIGTAAFRRCFSLTSVTIPDSVTSILDWAFSLCFNLTSIIMLPNNPPTLGFDAIPSNVTTITVPIDCGEAYKTAKGWSAYADKIVEATA